MTRYLCGSRAILQNSAASSLNFGLLSASIIQPGGGESWSGERMKVDKGEVSLHGRRDNEEMLQCVEVRPLSSRTTE